jgi:KipI family sensor histidine kinase inhibitor
LCEVADFDAAHRLRAAIVTAAYDEVVEVVPGWQTVLVVFAGPTDVKAVTKAIGGLEPAPEVRKATTLVIEVRYDGPDLAEVATHAGMTSTEVVQRHTAPTYTVAFLGFQPGFPYLAGMDPSLRTPRKTTPRTSVPTGAVGIADDVTGIYPQSSPGGWQLIGHTDVVLFDASADPPALLAPGDRVRFVAVSA